MQHLLNCLTHQVQDISAERATIKDKEIRKGFADLLAVMQPEDQLWEYEWYEPPGGRDCYSFGWCVIRQGRVIDIYCHSYS